MEALGKLLGADATAPGAPAHVDDAIWRALIRDDNAMTPERVALGRALYFERRLSADGTVSCATCHDATRHFTDKRNVSEGIRGQLGRRNAPTTMNAALLRVQFWDGRSKDLEEQAGQPILNPVEMGQPSREAAVATIKDDPGYQEMFRKAYGEPVTYAGIERAIASFERTLIFLDAPFDRFLRGDADAISPDARAGWALFNGKARCASCHTLNVTLPLGTDNRFHNIGVAAHAHDFEALAKQALAALSADASMEKLDALAVATDLSELGRFMVTRNYSDIGAFKTSQLRNVGVTGPYMHDGSMQTLWDVVDHYNKGGEDNRYLDGGIEALALSEQEIDQVVAFLFTLTDDRFAGDNAAAMTTQRDRAMTTRPFRDEALAQRKVLGFERRVEGAAPAPAPKQENTP
ncbi:MAG: cytochrome-c peroxidase [Deltaproteobacteria bacterium]|nr:cytochrome-c peroxidase [Deltaproteobacteria bacterium]